MFVLSERNLENGRRWSSSRAIIFPGQYNSLRLSAIITQSSSKISGSEDLPVECKNPFTSSIRCLLFRFSWYWGLNIHWAICRDAQAEIIILPLITAYNTGCLFVCRAKHVQRKYCSADNILRSYKINWRSCIWVKLKSLSFLDDFWEDITLSNTKFDSLRNFSSSIWSASSI